MISKNLKVFEINGRSYQFSIDGFRLEFARKAAKNNCRIGEYEQMLADSLFVSKDSVHNWRQKLNGPSDVDKIKKIAEFLRCDMMNLMTDVTEENTDGEKEMNNTEKTTLNDRQRDAVKRVYLEMLKVGDELHRNRMAGKPSWCVGTNLTRILNEEFIDIPSDLWNELTLFYWEKLPELRRWERTFQRVQNDCLAVYMVENQEVNPFETETFEDALGNLDYDDVDRVQANFLYDIVKRYEDSLRKVILPYL